MKQNSKYFNPYSSMLLFTSMLISLILVVSLSGCPEEVTQDYSISEVTIYNIPANIPVFGEENKTTPTYKVYIFASDSMSKDEPPVAKGLAKIVTPQPNGTYSITINLQNPNPINDKNPNLNTGSWSGTADFFSIMISPQDTSVNGVDSVWIKGGYTLNIGKKNIDWNGSPAILLMDFRNDIPGMDFVDKAQALYDDIICNDPDIKSKEL